MPPTGKLPFEGFSKLSFEDRLKRIQGFAGLSQSDLEVLKNGSNLTLEQAEHLIENVIGLYTMPIGLATHFRIDNREYAVPMVVEETSIVAAASSAAKWVHRNGGFQTRIHGKFIIGQIQFPSVRNQKKFAENIESNRRRLIELANKTVPNLVKRGGGIVDLQVRYIDDPDHETRNMSVIHVLCNPCDAMGANLINQVCEALKSPLEEITRERVGMCILSNLVDTKLVEATCEISDIDPELGDAIEGATHFANLDPYRGATHNKGVMNGIDAVLLATGNDWRAVEAGVHTFASREGKYRAVTEWKYRGRRLFGKILVPLAVGTVGGMTKVHPAAQVCLRILNIEHAEELSRVCAAVGLAQNLAALRALCSEGIVRGHMRLHAANLALAAGAEESEIKTLADLLHQEKNITFSRARELLVELRSHHEKNGKNGKIGKTSASASAVLPG